MLATWLTELARVFVGADIYGQLACPAFSAWSVCLDILGIEVVQGADSRELMC